MNATDPSITTNLKHWESRVAHHESSAEYGLEHFRVNPRHISEVVRFDLPRLGDISGLDVIHLQCHIGTDTLSLARLGANVTGLDFSPSAIDVAQRLSAEAGPAVHYVVSNVYDARTALGASRFDLVYTGIGALCWLPSVRTWAEVVASLLKPGGELFIREGHPVIWSVDDPRDDGVIALEYPYFETAGVVTANEFTYVDHAEPLTSPTLVHFNHGLAEIFNALWDAGFAITMFEEHDSIPWTALGDAMVNIGGGEYRLVDRPERVPMSYTLRATLRGV